ncbi:MAG TPA: queuosine salvage family protein [Trueperaceae bacterium]
MSILESVRAACREVARQARYVRFHEESLPAYLAALPLGEAAAPAYDLRHHFRGEPAATVAYVLTLDAVNFGSGYFPHLQKRPSMSGYFTVASRLKDAFEAAGPIPAAGLRALTPPDTARLFGQDLEDPVRRELMERFTVALADLGDFLLRSWGGSFTALVTAAEGSAETLVEILAEMPWFCDVSSYRGQEVPLMKRAQITASDLSLALDGQGYGWFRDLDRLTIFADNAVPHVLHTDGLLRYDEGLAARIEAGENIPAGSEEEVEIRAVALYAVERMAETLRWDGRALGARELDILLWNRGQGARYKSRKRHRTRTVFY